MPPGSQEQRHLHTQSRRFFYLPEGELTIELSGERHLLMAGSGIEIAPGEPHHVLNTSVKEVRLLVISQPPATETGNPHNPCRLLYWNTEIQSEVTQWLNPPRESTCRAVNAKLLPTPLMRDELRLNRFSACRSSCDERRRCH